MDYLIKQGYTPYRQISYLRMESLLSTPGDSPENYRTLTKLCKEIQQYKLALALSKALICGMSCHVYHFLSLVACYYTHTFMHFKFMFSCDYSLFMQVTLRLVFVVFQRVDII